MSCATTRGSPECSCEWAFRVRPFDIIRPGAHAWRLSQESISAAQPSIRRCSIARPDGS
jgi:hypothetical protein